MKEKLFLFLVLVLIACAMVFFGAETKKIVCSNRNHTCYMLTENSLLKSSKEGHIFDVSHKNENVTNDFGDNPDLGHFVCKARRASVHENSKRTNKIRYYLAPFTQRHDLKFSKPRALNSYSSLWHVTLMYRGLNSMNGFTDSTSSRLVMPFIGGTISSDGKGFELPFSMSLIFILPV